LSGSDHLSDIGNARKDLLLGMYLEMRTHARHAETLRSNVISYTLALTSALIVVIALDTKLNKADLPICAAIIVLGLVSTLFSASYAELFHRNWQRAKKLSHRLDILFFDGESDTIAELLKQADDDPENHRFYGWIRERTGSTQRFWLVAPISVVLAGIVLTIYAAIA
jgi:hypothetical protein